MKKIFVFWIIFLVILIIGIALAISSKSALNREEKRAEELKKAVISRPSRLPKLPVVSEIKVEEPKAQVEPPAKTEEETPITPPTQSELPTSGEIPPMQGNIPVQINTNSLEISVPAPQSSNPLTTEESQLNPTTPQIGQ